MAFFFCYTLSDSYAIINSIHHIAENDSLHGSLWSSFVRSVYEPCDLGKIHPKAICFALIEDTRVEFNTRDSPERSMHCTIIHVCVYVIKVDYSGLLCATLAL